MSGYRRLTAVSGVGERKADRLYAEGYENIVDLKHATQAELADVDGIGNALAARIKADVGEITDGLTLKEVVEDGVAFICPDCGATLQLLNGVFLDQLDDRDEITVECYESWCGALLYEGDPDPYVDTGLCPSTSSTGHPAQAAGSGQQPLGDCPGCGTTVTDADDERIEDGDAYCSVGCYNEVEPW